MPGDSGYDEEFVDPPPEYLKCVVCYLVLQQPVQIATCGHRYCSTCYDRVKGFAKHLNAPFTCPVDRTEIDETKVLEDNGMARIVLDLKVKCSCHWQGCKWSGELRDLYAHKNQCPQVLKQLRCGLESEDNPLLMIRMNDRVGKCEESLREVALFKAALKELQEKGDQRGKEMELLKTQTEEMKQEIASLKETNKGLKEKLIVTQRKLHTLEREGKKKFLVTAANPKTGQKRKKEDEHLYVNVQVLTEDVFCKWSGQDLFETDSVEPVEFKILKTEKLKNATQIIGEFFGYAAAQCRLCIFHKRANGTRRPGRFDFDRSDGVHINGDTELFVAAEHDPDILLFLERCQRGVYTLPKFDDKDVLVFFKYYDPSSETMSYCGHAYVDRKSKPFALFPLLCERAGLPKGTRLLFYEEQQVGTTVKISTDKAFDECVYDLLDGDIICFQVCEQDLKQWSKPTPIEYFKG